MAATILVSVQMSYICHHCSIERYRAYFATKVGGNRSNGLQERFAFLSIFKLVAPTILAFVTKSIVEISSALSDSIRNVTQATFRSKMVAISSTVPIQDGGCRHLEFRFTRNKFIVMTHIHIVSCTLISNLTEIGQWVIFILAI